MSPSMISTPSDPVRPAATGRTRTPSGALTSTLGAPGPAPRGSSAAAGTTRTSACRARTTATTAGCPIRAVGGSRVSTTSPYRPSGPGAGATAAIRPGTATGPDPTPSGPALSTVTVTS